MNGQIGGLKLFDIVFLLNAQGGKLIFDPAIFQLQLLQNDGPGQSKITQLDFSQVDIGQYIFGLEIPMEHLALMTVFES